MQEVPSREVLRLSRTGIQRPLKVVSLIASASLATLLVGYGAPSAASAAAATELATVREPIGGGYILVPKTIAKNVNLPPQILLAGTSRGVVVALAPKYAPLPGGMAPQTRWTVWFARTGPANENLLRGAQLRATFPQGALSLSGVTGAFAVFASRGQVFSLRLWGGAITPPRSIGTLAPGNPPVFARRGYSVFEAPLRVLRVVQLATGKHGAARIVPGQTLSFQGGAYYEGSRPVPLPFPSPYRHTLPPGFRWISVARGSQPFIGVPSDFRVTEEPGGSSQGVIAKDPKDLSISVTVWSNACAGCYNPAIMAPSVYARNTPVYVQRTPGMQPIGDHGYITAQPGVHGLVTYTRVAYWPGGGDDDFIVTVPAGQKALAMKILSTAWLP